MLHPDGRLEWLDVDADDEADKLAGGAEVATARQWLGQSCPLRLIASDVSMLFPDRFEPNPHAERVITALSQNYIHQSWRGVVVLFHPDQDGFCQPMDPHWVQEITRLHGGG